MAAATPSGTAILHKPLTSGRNTILIKAARNMGNSTASAKKKLYTQASTNKPVVESWAMTSSDRSVVLKRFLGQDATVLLQSALHRMGSGFHDIGDEASIVPLLAVFCICCMWSRELQYVTVHPVR